MQYDTWKLTYANWKRKVEQTSNRNEVYTPRFENCTNANFTGEIEDIGELIEGLDQFDKAFKTAWDTRKRTALEKLQKEAEFYAQDNLKTLYDDDLFKALKDILAWTDNELDKHTSYHLSKAATLISTAFGRYIPDDYKRALMETFGNTQPDSNEPQYSYVQHTPNSWLSRFRDIGIDETKAHEAKGMTVRWDGSDKRCVKELMRSHTAPYNSVIEVQDTSYDTLVHEMLHWITHDAYEKYTRDYALKINGQHDTQITREGTTEWLKRHARGNWEKGGYTDVFPVVDKALRGNSNNNNNNNEFGPEHLMKAYFGGIEVEATCKKLLDSYHKPKEEGLRIHNELLTTRFPDDVGLLNRVRLGRGWNKDALWELAENWPDNYIALLETQLGNKEAADYVRQRKKSGK